MRFDFESPGEDTGVFEVEKVDWLWEKADRSCMGKDGSDGYEKL